MESVLLGLGTFQKLHLEVNGTIPHLWTCGQVWTSWNQSKPKFELKYTVQIIFILFIIFIILIIFIIIIICIYIYIYIYTSLQHIICGWFPLVLPAARATERIPCFFRAWARIDLAPCVGFVAVSTAVVFLDGSNALEPYAFIHIPY